MDPLSQAFAHALFQAFPDWHPFATEFLDADGARCMELTIPQEGTDRCLRLDTAGNRITIAYDRWHTHVGPFLGMSVAESAAAAISIIGSFLTERTVVVIETLEGKWLGSRLEYREAPCPIATGCTSEIFSWRRTYDRIIENE